MNILLLNAGTSRMVHGGSFTSPVRVTPQIRVLHAEGAEFLVDCLEPR
jgi:hypothetical protein